MHTPHVNQSKKVKKLYSNISWLIAAIIIASIVFAFPRYDRPQTEATIAWDVSGYYLYLPAVFIYKDLRELNFLPGIIETYHPSHFPDQAYLHSQTSDGSNRMVMKYPLGMALLYLPFFLLAHLVAHFGDFPADGFSYPYQVAILLGSVAIGLVGLWFTKKNLQLFFSDKVTAVTILLIAVGTNFLNYATFDAAMTHLHLFAVFSVLFYLTVRWHENPSWRLSFGIGLCIGLAALVRPTDIIIALVPLFYGIINHNSLQSKISLLAQHWQKLLALVLTVALVGFLQLAYWKYAAGEWIIYSYQEQGFSFLNPHFSNVLFSFRKGWFVYTPLMVMAVIGFVFLAKQRQIFTAILLFFLINTWIVSSWDVWWYGGSLGQRAMVQSYALLAFPLAASLSWLSDKAWKRWLAAPLIIFCILLNLFQTYQAHWGPYEADMMTKAYYLRIFGKTFNNPYDRFLIDTNEYFDESRPNFREIYANNLDDLNLAGLSEEFVLTEPFSFYVNDTLSQSPSVSIPVDEMVSGRWLHISASYYSSKKEWEVWWMPQTVVLFEKEGKVVKEKFIRPFHVLQKNEWRELGLDVKIPEQPFDSVKVFMRNPRTDSNLFMDNLRVGIFDGD